MQKQSAGILMYRFNKDLVEVLLVHPGGPFYTKKDLGVWSIPKGEFFEGEDPGEAAIREFKEETGQTLNGRMIELSPIIQKSGKKVFAWAVEGNIDPSEIISNTFSIEWPPKSGQMKEFAEIDRGEWFAAGLARTKINQAQVLLINELCSLLNFK